MRKLLVFSLVVGVVAVAASADDGFSVDLGGNGSFPGPIATGDGPPLVWDNGVADGVNGFSPTNGWDTLGLLDNFTLPSGGGTTFSQVRIEMIDGTGGLGQPSTTDAARIRIYELGAGGLGALDHDSDVPVFDQTYTEAGGTMTEVDSGVDMFDRDLIYFDLSSAETNLGPGDFALFVSYPGVPAGADSFMATSAHPFTAGVDDAHVFGSGVNAAFSTPSDVAFNLSIPEPATLSLLGIGAVAMLRRRR